MKSASKPRAVGSSRSLRAMDASCRSHWCLSLLTSAQKLINPLESKKTTSYAEWKLSREAGGVVVVEVSNPLVVQSVEAKCCNTTLNI